VVHDPARKDHAAEVAIAGEDAVEWRIADRGIVIEMRIDVVDEIRSRMDEHGVVEHEEHTEHGTHLRGRLPVELAGRFAPYWVQEEVK